MDLYNKLKTGGGYESTFVKEIIINNEKDEQESFIREIEKRMRGPRNDR
jgi:hypothetical protein